MTCTRCTPKSCTIEIAKVTENEQNYLNDLFLRT